MSDDRLRPLWVEGSLDTTEKNLRAALAAETSDSGRAEVLTQLARVQWARGLVDAHELLEEANELAGEDPVARARVLLERGRLVRRLEGDAAGLTVLEQAYDAALAAGQHFMAADAAHACALAGDMVRSTERGLDLAERFPAAAYWRGTLLMNLGDWQLERGEYEEALSSFEAALEAREQETRYPSVTQEARYGAARALRALGRPAEAIPLLELVVEWLDQSPVDWLGAKLYREELAAVYDDVGRTADAAAQRAALA